MHLWPILNEEFQIKFFTFHMLPVYIWFTWQTRWSTGAIKDTSARFQLVSWFNIVGYVRSVLSDVGLT